MTATKAAPSKRLPISPNLRRTGKAVKPSPITKKGSPSFTALPKGKAVKIVDIRNRLGFSQDELSRITGYSVRAIAGWEAGKSLSEAARQKVLETERLRSALAEFVPASELGEWMRTSNPAFEGQTPIQVIERGEADRIWRMIFQIEGGVAN